MDPDLRAYLDWLDRHGVRYAVAKALAREPEYDGSPLGDDAELRPVELDGIPPFVEHRDPAAGLGSDHATLSLARAVLPRLAPGQRFFDVGCGTGVLAVAAGLRGARGVVATDVDPRAIALARRTAADADVAVRFCQGSLLAAVPPDLPADVVAANLPHKPCPPGGGLPLAQAGGADGAAVHVAFADQAEARLPKDARVVFFLHSLPHPRLLLRYHEAFDLELLSWKRRFLGEGEYGPFEGHFRDLARDGLAHLGEADGRPFLVAGCWMARRR